MKRVLSFRPQLLECLRGYCRKDLFADLEAVVTVGVVALPLAMAFAIASGVPPQAGIITAVVAGFLISVPGNLSAQAQSMSVRLAIRVHPDLLSRRSLGLAGLGRRLREEASGGPLTSILRRLSETLSPRQSSAS